MAQINNNEPLTVEKVQETLKEYDMIIRPKALVVSPKMKKELLEKIPTIEDRVKSVIDVHVIESTFIRVLLKDGGILNTKNWRCKDGYRSS